jgi:superfamily I DNA/RNA helicase
VYKGYKTFLAVLVNKDERAVAEYLHAHNTELENAVIKRLAKAPPARLSKKDGVPTAHQAGLRKCLRAVRACLSITDAKSVMRAYQNNFGGEMNKWDPNGLCRYVRWLGIDLTGIQLGDLMKALDDRDREETKTETGVELLTIHKAKGGGWKYVFVIDVYEGGIPSFKDLNSLEELRNFFVALTRSSKELFISGINQETWASTIAGTKEDGQTIVKTHGKRTEEVWLDKSGNVKKWKSDPNPNATGIVTRKPCRYIKNGDALRKVADVRYFKRNEES